MRAPWTLLDEHERAIFQVVVAFLDKRLSQSETVLWAAGLKKRDRIQRNAIEFLLRRRDATDIREPWASSWQYIEESWSADIDEHDDSTSIYSVDARLRSGDRSGALVTAIVRLVEPYLTVEPRNPARWQLGGLRRNGRPKKYSDLISVRLNSPPLLDIDELHLANVQEAPFLESLAKALEGAVNKGIETARRLGWDGVRNSYLLGDVSRVYFVGPVREDPDTFHRGIAPAVKLLHAVVKRIAASPAAARQFVTRARIAGDSLHNRLWSAFAREETLATSDEVEHFLIELDNKQFWDVHSHPEVAELRAVRYRTLSEQAQKLLARRIIAGPPRSYWSRHSDPEKLRDARLYWSVRELQRIRAAGGQLPKTANGWLGKHLQAFPDLHDLGVEAGFRKLAELRSETHTPGDRYNTLEGGARLIALETAFVTRRGGWDDDPAERARVWLSSNAAEVLADLASVNDAGSTYPAVWERLGWAHSPMDKVPERRAAEVEQMCSLLIRLPPQTLSGAISGISHWLDTWKGDLARTPNGAAAWFCVWPISVESTNARAEPDPDPDLEVISSTGNDPEERLDLDTLNTPAGKLVGVFLAYCPELGPNDPSPFRSGSVARRMRDTIIAAHGRTAIIVRHRLIESLPYFLRSDRDWTQRNLIEPLLRDDAESLSLWRAVARRTRPVPVVEIIGSAMAERATDRRLARETRRALAFNVVIESLHAFRERRGAMVANPRVQQMLRMLDDETRAFAADAVQRFVHDLSAPNKGGTEIREELFRGAALPFLNQVWPAERSLATPGVAAAFADLPAVCGEAFAEAVATIERFLVPFECWSLFSYGFYEGRTEAAITMINDERKALALLQLLHLTVGTTEGSIIPNDLSTGLEQIRNVAPRLESDSRFRRLAATARS